ncbi:venom carboxylesterase-6-like [Anthonomus grandis grandis]|uniref:venom carboxylesterase-6-like n=1 Tax=Anthonomus grandis grandis TaxID=2921223 RepID=UPI002165D661|nr:venom carboxylesterase-6-like [Anthonomus grandis grandis]
MKYSNLILFGLISSVFGDALVELPNGKIQGKTEYTRTGVAFNSFYGIKYGQNPTGKLRLQPPKEVEPWDGVFDATVEKGMCYQVPKDYEMETEDCLLLNLYTPVTEPTPNASLPVMFFIHGGGFVEGTGILEWGVGPHFFMENEVIMIAINYRLGPFGYMSTGDDVIPGNLGQKDQILALQWVQKNIKYFGGDPEKVTIFGQSAGAASVSYQLLSPLSQGLFRAAIQESGSAVSPWAFQRDQVEITYKTAALLNPEFETNRNSTELLSFLQSVSAKELDEASYNLTKKLEYPGDMQISKGFFYTPVIEHEHENPFLTKHQYESFENGSFNRVPLLIGFNAEESLFMMTRTFHRTLKAYDGNTSYLVPFDMHISNQDTLLEVGNSIKKFYSPESNLEDNKLGGVQYHSTQDFDKSVIKQAELQAPFVPVYLYEFTYSGKMGNNPKHLNGSGAVGHGEEQNYIFNRWLSVDLPDNSDFTKFSEDDVNVHYYFVKLFTNFAKTLNPTPQEDSVLQNVTWPTLQPGNWQYLEIARDLILHDAIPKKAMYNFWKDLYSNYALRPYDTY